MSLTLCSFGVFASLPMAVHPLCPEEGHCHHQLQSRGSHSLIEYTQAASSSAFDPISLEALRQSNFRLWVFASLFSPGCSLHPRCFPQSSTHRHHQEDWRYQISLAHPENDKYFRIICFDFPQSSKKCLLHYQALQLVKFTLTRIKPRFDHWTWDHLLDSNCK